MNLFHSFFPIFCIVCEFSLYNIISCDDRISFDSDDNADSDIGEVCIDNDEMCQLISDCPEILNRIKSGQTNHTVCGYKKLEQKVCCPSILSRIAENCYDDHDKYIEVIGETCTNEISGTEGKYRWSKQCPFHSNTQLKLKYSCCTEVVCCPDIDMIPSLVHEQKCLEYGRSTFEGKLKIEGPYTDEINDNCDLDISVHGGILVSKGEFPFMAALGFENGNGGFNYDCGGTLISEKYVLTAGHCLLAPGVIPVVTVRLGAISMNESESKIHGFKDYLVIERIPHPNYKRKSQYNDIALLLLDGPVEFSRFIRPACLPNSIEITELVTAMGWGTTETESRSPNLLQVNIQIFTHAQCNQSFSVNRKLELGIVDETQVCAGSMDSNRDTCQGDSGGPLVSKHTKLYALHTVVGITSMGQFCGTAGIPGVYTRVFPYVDWIQSIVWPNTTNIN